MTEYAFFTSQLRFVARKTDRESDDVAAMMSSLERIADEIDAGANYFFVEKNNLRTTARALAGVAGFLQQHILPEILAAKNTAGEAQVRWTIDQCMTMMANIMTHAELNKDAKDMDVKLAPPPL